MYFECLLLRSIARTSTSIRINSQLTKVGKYSFLQSGYGYKRANIKPRAHKSIYVIWFLLYMQNDNTSSNSRIDSENSAVEKYRHHQPRRLPTTHWWSIAIVTFFLLNVKWHVLENIQINSIHIRWMGIKLTRIYRLDMCCDLSHIFCEDRIILFEIAYIFCLFRCRYVLSYHPNLMKS